MNIGYYPGCALHGSSNDYEQSLRACLSKLGVELSEMRDWICCGATAAHSLNHKLSVALPARNLALAESQQMEQVLAPCPLCSMQLLKASAQIKSDENLRKELATIVEMPVEGRSKVLNLIEIFQNVGLEALKAAVSNKLESIQAACYYGCLLTRPPAIVQFDDAERPQSMEAVVQALGAKTVEWNFKTECCGAGMTMADEDTVLELGHRILENAAAHGANCIVVACPMCHVNLDMRQSAIIARYGGKPLPVYYLSDLAGLALGLKPKELGIDRHFVEAEPCPA
jgi:heterodisulfide reductase subunit B